MILLFFNGDDFGFELVRHDVAELLWPACRFSSELCIRKIRIDCGLFATSLETFCIRHVTSVRLRSGFDNRSQFPWLKMSVLHPGLGHVETADSHRLQDAFRFNGLDDGQRADEDTRVVGGKEFIRPVRIHRNHGRSVCMALGCCQELARENRLSGSTVRRCAAFV